MFEPTFVASQVSTAEHHRTASGQLNHTIIAAWSIRVDNQFLFTLCN